MKEKIKQVTLDDEEKMQILLRAIDRMPLNPSAQGWSGAAIRRQLAASITGEQHSVLSNLISKLAVIQDLFYEVEDRLQALDISSGDTHFIGEAPPDDVKRYRVWLDYSNDESGQSDDLIIETELEQLILPKQEEEMIFPHDVGEETLLIENDEDESLLF